MKRAFSGLLFSVFLAFASVGCGGKEETADIAVPPPSSEPMNVENKSLVPTDSAPPVAPPPPTDSSAASTQAGTPQAPAAGGAATLASGVGSIQGDPLAFYRYDSEGRQLSDLAALQNAVDAYNRSAGQTFTETDKPKPPLSKLEDLVANGALRGIPPPPNGQRYVFDPAAQKVSVAN